MNVFVAAILIVASLFLMCVIVVRNLRSDIPADARSRYVPYLMVMNVVVFSSDMLCGGGVCLRLLTDLSLAVSAMCLLALSLSELKFSLRMLALITVSQAALAIYYFTSYSGIFPMAGDNIWLVLPVLPAVSVMMFFFWTIWRRVYNIKLLMKSCTVWSDVCLYVDVIYVMALLFAVMLALSMSMLAGRPYGLMISICLLGGEMSALGVRLVLDSAFVLMHKHERVIVESMKISQVEVMNSSPKDDEMYQDLYERVLLYFEMKKPYLNNELTINDVVKVVYSNRVYISKAISHYTGRNFRQFVNYYRIMYSMESFRNNPGLKVAELSGMSGFNSVVSYTTAFRLFMNETPSEWCRKERSKLLKTKK